jgi:large subunit ribosomal protein L6
LTVTAAGASVGIKGPKGEMAVALLPHVAVKVEADGVRVTGEGTTKQAIANTGTMWSLLKNAIQGTGEGFAKVLEIEGVGYKAALEGKTLVLSLGFSQPVRFDPPEGVAIAVDKNVITVSGMNKEQVGQAAAEIRAFRKPEPYKGKGIHYRGEFIRRKVGKKAATATAAG